MKKLISALLVAALFALWLPGAVSAEDGAAASDFPVMESFEVSYEDWALQYVSEHLDEIKAISAAAPEYWRDFGFASLGEFLEANEMSREEYTIAYEAYDYLWELYMEAGNAFMQEALPRWIGDVREYLGAVRTGLGVMLNGKYVSFPDAQPEISSGRTMIPLRALMESMGAQVSYDTDGKGSLVSVLVGSTELKFYIGGSTLYLSSDGKSETIEMDSSPYIKNDRTYVPIRFFSEALGYDVLWDAKFETAVVLDKNALIPQLDKDFTYFNKLLSAMSGKVSGTSKTAVDFTAVITKFSTLDGDIQSSISGSVTVISDGMAQQISMNLDFSRLIEIFLSQAEYPIPQELSQKLSGLRHMSGDLILNFDEGLMYLHYPQLNELMGISPADAWVMAEISSDTLPELPFEAPDLFAELSGKSTIGEHIYSSVVYNADDFCQYGYFPALVYNDLISAAGELSTVCGNSTFSVFGDTATWKIDRDSYEMLNYGELPESSADYDYKELNITLSISDYSGIKCDFALRPNNFYGSDYRISGGLSMLGQHTQLNLEVHTNNLMKLNLSLSANTSEGTLPAAARPPEGSTVLTQEQLGQLAAS